MDKLEPILKQKFWILLGVGIIMTIVGWWMAAGSLAATITARKDALDKVEGSIPSGELPNNDWSTKLAEINGRQEALVRVARLEMWKRQEARVFWPPNVDSYAKQIPYEGEFGVEASELYRENYPSDVERIWKISRPFNPLDGTGIVMFPFASFPQQRSGDLTPTSKQMWERQQDLWLLEPIMQAILAVNGGENGTRADASIHAISRLELLGGDRSKLGGDATGVGMTSESGMPEGYDGGAGALDLSALSGGGGGFGMGGYGAAAGGAPAPVAADFDPKEEYGDGGTLGGGGYGGFGGLGSSAAMPTGESADSGSADGLAVSGGPAEVRRYVDDEEALPYKTRAFYLSVVMDHRKLPDLIGALTANGDSAWPIEIGRVQVVRLNPDEGVGQAGGGSLASMMPSSGSQYGGGSAQYGAAGAYAPAFGGGGAGDYLSGETSGEYDTSSAFGGGLNFGGRPMGAPGAGFEATFADPSLAKVALCGLIYIYKPITEQAATEQPAATPETAAPAAETPTAAGEAAPAESTEPPATPADTPADPNAPPSDTPPADTEAAPAPSANAPAAPAPKEDSSPPQ
jgi:hypothetical protein